MLLALYGVFANVGTFSVLCSIRLTFSIPRPYGSETISSGWDSQPVHAEGDGEGENPLLHVDEAVMGLSVHTNGDGAGDNPLQAYYTTAVHSAITASACIVYTT